MEPDTIDKQLRYSLLAILIIGVAAISAYFIWFGLALSEPLSKDTGTWGEFGDYIGGLMNPLVAACALYWLTMSVRLQKTELAATRSELAASRLAQENQAGMALFAAQINSMTLRLNAVVTELGHAQSRLNYVLERMDTVGASCSVHDLNGGTAIPGWKVANALEKQIIDLQKKQAAILAELDIVQSLALGAQTEPEYTPSLHDPS